MTNQQRVHLFAALFVFFSFLILIIAASIIAGEHNRLKLTVASTILDNTNTPSGILLQQDNQLGWLDPDSGKISFIDGTHNVGPLSNDRSLHQAGGLDSDKYTYRYKVRKDGRYALLFPYYKPYSVPEEQTLKMLDLQSGEIATITKLPQRHYIQDAIWDQNDQDILLLVNQRRPAESMTELFFGSSYKSVFHLIYIQPKQGTSQIQKIKYDTHSPFDSSYSTDYRLLRAGSRQVYIDGRGSIFEINNNDATPQLIFEYISSNAFLAADDIHHISSSYEDRIELFNLLDKTVVSYKLNIGSTVRDGVFDLTPDGQKIIFAWHSKPLYSYDLHSKEIFSYDHIVGRGSKPINALIVEPNGKRVFYSALSNLTQRGDIETMIFNSAVQTSNIVRPYIRLDGASKLIGWY